MTPIERGARALALSQSGVDEWDALDEAFQENIKDHVRAVLQAVREPSKTMLDKGIDAAEEVEDWTSDSFQTYRVDSASDMPLPVWRAMIDAALSE